MEWFNASGSLTKLTLINFGIQWAGFAVAAYFKTEKFYDLTGSATFILVSYLNYKWNNVDHPRQLVQSSCVWLWAFRLGIFLFVRILLSGRDRRFDKTRANPSRFLYAWTLQGMWVVLTLLPSLLSIES